MKFVDSCQLMIRAGCGGNGAVAFRREKSVPFGGPSGGDGGRGGDVVFIVDGGKTSLLDLTYVRDLEATKGQNGMGADCYGRMGADREVRVPPGTQVWDRDSGKLLFDLSGEGTRVVVAKGGRGGRGNMHFATPHDRAPRRSEPGDLGEERSVRLELKVMADVGLLGFPNAGKSTFIASSSRARPKIADYPFTTLVPHLGVVDLGSDAEDRATFVMADIPGLIPGASEGAGLGLRFLKHVERTRALLHLITLDPGEGRDPIADFKALTAELHLFDPELAARPTVVALTKADLPEVKERYPALKLHFAKQGIELHLVSAATQEGLRPLLFELLRVVRGADPKKPPQHSGKERSPAANIAKKSATAKKASAKPNKQSADDKAGLTKPKPKATVKKSAKKLTKTPGKPKLKLKPAVKKSAKKLTKAPGKPKSKQAVKKSAKKLTKTPGKPKPVKKQARANPKVSSNQKRTKRSGRTVSKTITPRKKKPAAPKKAVTKKLSRLPKRPVAKKLKTKRAKNH